MLRFSLFLLIFSLGFSDTLTIRENNKFLLLKIRYQGLNSESYQLIQVDSFDGFKRYVSKDGLSSLVKEHNNFIGYIKYKKNYLKISQTNKKYKLTRHITLKNECQNKTKPIINKSLFSKAITPRSKIELGLLFDKKYFDIYGATSRLKILSIINSVDALYRSQLGISLEPRFLISTPISLSATSSLFFLLELKDSYSSLSSKADLIHLFTGSTSFDSVLGLSFVGSTCQNDSLNFGFSARTLSSLETIVTAHEIGHSLNATHPEDSLIFPNASLMTGVVAPNQNTFSDFSKNEVNNFLPGNNCLTSNIFEQTTFKSRYVKKHGKQYLNFFIQNPNLINGSMHTVKIFYKGKLFFSKRTHLNYLSETINFPKKYSLKLLGATFE